MNTTISDKWEFFKNIEVVMKGREIIDRFRKIESTIGLPLRPIIHGSITNQPLIDPPNAAKIAQYTIEANGLLTEIQNILSSIQPINVGSIISNANAILNANQQGQ